MQPRIVCLTGPVPDERFLGILGCPLGARRLDRIAGALAPVAH